MTEPVLPSSADTERQFCLACGTVTRDRVCDCNRYGQTDCEPRFVNYADEMAKEAGEWSKRAADLESLLGAAQAVRQPGEEHPVLKHADELHDLGFNAGWNGAIEESAKIAEYNGWERTAEQIRALAAQPPAAPVETEEWEEVTDGTTLPGDRFSYIGNSETGVGQITSHKRRVQRLSADTDDAQLLKLADQNLYLRGNEIKLDATVRIFRKALQHISDQRWGEEVTVERLCDHSDNTLEREVKSGELVTPAEDRRAVWLRLALYNIQVGRCVDPREHARIALKDDDLIASLLPAEPQTPINPTNQGELK